MATSGPCTVTTALVKVHYQREMQLTWTWTGASYNNNAKNLDCYKVQWLYSYKKPKEEDPVWYNDGSPQDVPLDAGNISMYTPPDYALSVKAKVRPVSKTHDVNGTETAYFTSGWKESNVFKLDGSGNIEKLDPSKLKNLKITIQKHSERTMVATWNWGHDKRLFDHYELEWRYTTGDGKWYLGTTDEVNEELAVYDARPEAKKVSVKVLPVSKTHWVKGVEVPYWQTEWSAEAIFVLDAGKAKTLAPIPDNKINLVLLADTERDMHVTWEWEQDDTESYSVQWGQYDEGNKFWINEDVKEVTRRMDQFTADTNSERVRVRIRPNAKTITKNGDEVKAWKSDWSNYIKYSFGAGSVSDVGKITDITLGIQNESDRTVYAKWTWDRDNTVSYNVEWSYDTGDGFWYEDGGTNTTLKQATYSAPTNAKEVRFIVTPVANTHLVNGETVPFWNADPSDAKTISLQASVPDTLTDMVTNIYIGIQAGTDRTVYATWEWSHEFDHTESYTVIWAYDTGNGVWFEEGETSVTQKQSIYSAPPNAVRVKIRIKPISETYTEFGKTVAYWDAPWSSDTADSGTIFTFATVAEVPPAPSISIKQYTLTAEEDVTDKNTARIEFQIVRNNTEIFTGGMSQVVLGYASFSCSVSAGGEYKARCRAYTSDGAESEWSDYSESVGTIPQTPAAITGCHALTTKSVELTWTPVQNADSYDIQYTTNKLYFDTSNDVQSMSVESIVQRAIVTSLSEGEEWFFRVRATNANGSSGWTAPASVILGRAPDVPTTWSQTTIVMVGEDAILYWVHNSEDGSHQTAARIELTIGGNTETKTVTFTPSEDDEEEEETSSYTVPTGSYAEGTSIKWRVQTKGIVEEYSPWSILRTIDVYAPPTLVLGLSQENKWYWDPFNFLTDDIYTAYGEVGAFTDVLTSFPFYITATPGPPTQKPVGYYLTIKANETYETINQVGETEWVNAGDEIYSKYFDAVGDHLFVALTPKDIDLENMIYYTVHCSVYMDSGLMAEASAIFHVEWEEVPYIPNAEIGLDKSNVATYICPYCRDGEGNLVGDVTLSVYRREFDGAYTELCKNIENTGSTYITDPHPALDFARYRIVTTSKKTGAVGYYDAPGYPVNEKVIIIQWNDQWSSFEGDEGVREIPPWTGSMLKLPYNIDVSDDNEKDVSLVKYIGRTHPVSYYGTQVGGSATWNADIDRSDTETLYQLRRLMRYMGDVYVREPSGSGYWANIAVSFSQKHCEVTIPVTLSITRVDGGA